MTDKLFPLCLNGKDHFTNSDGHWLPCCFLPSMGPRYKQLPFSGDFWKIDKNKDDYYFSHSEQFQRWIKIQIENPEKAHHTCIRMCSATHKISKRQEQDVQRFNLTKDTVNFNSLDI